MSVVPTHSLGYISAMNVSWPSLQWKGSCMVLVGGQESCVLSSGAYPPMNNDIASCHTSHFAESLFVRGAGKQLKSGI